MKANESGMAESSEYPVRPGTKDCQFYLRTGRCGYGENCCYNHPKYFLRGKCKYGSHCDFDHSKEGDGAEHMPQERQENDNDQQKLVEQRKRDTERQRREARLRLKQIKQTVHFDEAIRIRETLTELGFILTEGDGF
ncbi:hypothetical protein N665_0518s0017 [Sinapis alba]|nr:hypothetical protein N665_0518s0017 [Sinapis alba]